MTEVDSLSDLLDAGIAPDEEPSVAASTPEPDGLARAGAPDPAAGGPGDEG